MNNRVILVMVCFVLVGSFVLAAFTPTLQALLLDNTAPLGPAEPTMEPTATVAPIGPHSEYVPVILDTVSTPITQPTPTSTLEVEPTATVAPPPTSEVEPTATVAPPPTVPPTDEPG